MDGGRKLRFERSFSLEREVKPKRSFWTRVVDVIAGEPDFHYLVSPYSVVTDSRGRIIVTDVAAAGVHIFDFEQQKYKFLSRRDDGKRSDAHAAVRGRRCAGQYLCDRFAGGQDFCLRCEREISAA